MAAQRRAEAVMADGRLSGAEAVDGWADGEEPASSLGLGAGTATSFVPLAGPQASLPSRPSSLWAFHCE